MTETEPVAPAPVQPAAPPTEPPRKSRVGSFFFGAFTGCFIVIVGFIVVSLIVTAGKMQSTTGDVFSTQKVAVIPIEGEIFEAREFIDLLHRYADSTTVRAIVVRINSPGGAIAPSQEMYEEIRKVHERSGKPIVASLDNVAASGGFYIASACDPIVSNPGTITGSIGVILQWVEIKDLMKWAKVQPVTITSGPLKDTGSPFRDLTDAERAYLQRVTDQLHSQFVRAVAEGRKGKLTEQQVATLADGRIFTGEEALALKLVDRLGNLDDAVLVAARMAGVRGKPATIYPRKQKPTLFDLLTDTTDSESLINRVLSRRVGFLYRW